MRARLGEACDAARRQGAEQPIGTPVSQEGVLHGSCQGYRIVTILQCDGMMAVLASWLRRERAEVTHCCQGLGLFLSFSSFSTL